VRLKKPGTPMTAVAPAPSKATLKRRGGLDLSGGVGDAQQLFLVAGLAASCLFADDESAVPEYPVTDWIPTHATVEMQRYPQPGDPNPAVRVGVVSAQAAKQCG